jgi:hypothetical protein
MSEVYFNANKHDDVKCWIQSNYTKGGWAYERQDRGDGVGDSTHKSRFYPTYLMWGDPGDSGTWANTNFSFCAAQPTSGTGIGHCGYGSQTLDGWSTY